MRIYEQCGKHYTNITPIDIADLDTNWNWTILLRDRENVVNYARAN